MKPNFNDYFFIKYSDLRASLFIKSLLLRKYFTELEPFDNILLKISNAFLISSFFLTLLKILYGLFPPFINFTFLLVFSIFSYFFNFHFYFQMNITKFLQKALPPAVLECRDSLIDDYIQEWEFLPEEQNKWIALKTSKWHQKLVLHVFMFFIWLRLVLLMEPLLYGLIYSMVVVFLIFNKFIIVTQLMSIVLIIARLCFTLNMKSLNNLLSILQRFSENDLKNPEISIKASYKNTVIITFVIISNVNENYYKYNILLNEPFIKERFIIMLIYDYNLELFNVSEWPLIMCRKTLLSKTLNRIKKITTSKK